MKRREMIKKALGLGALISLPGSIIPNELLADSSEIFPAGSAIGNPLRFPPVLTGNTMTASVTNQTVWPGQTSQLVTINNSYPGPTVIIERGSTLNINFVNNLSEDSIIHWHGIIAPEVMDGHPMYAIHPGQTYNYSFPIVQRAGTYWYHPHADMLTASQAFKGLAGFFIVTDQSENALNLPSGNFDIPLCIQDRRSVNIPQFTYNPNSTDMMVGFLGDVPLINGTPDAYFQVSRTLYRFRLLNGSNARIYKIAFSDNRAFHIIGTDGGLKDAPVSATSFYISPGERVEILFDFSPYTIGQSVTLKSLPFTGSGGPTYQQGTEMNLLRFDITSNTSSGGVVPASLTPITYYNPSDVVRTRSFTLSHASGGMNMHLINGLTFSMNRIDFEVPQNGLEQWKIVNATNEFHPMHSHGILFQVLSRNGSTTLAPNDKGWKDTVLVNPYEQVIVLIKFTQYKGIYMWHCHNLEHEDDGMMLNFKVVDPIGINEENSGVPKDFRLHQNYPNPFNPSTKIKYSVPQTNGGVNVELVVLDETGREIETLVNKVHTSGNYEIQWNAANRSSGIYYCKLITGNYTETIKMILVK